MNFVFVYGRNCRCPFCRERLQPVQSHHCDGIDHSDDDTQELIAGC